MSKLGYCSRSRATELIRAGKVRVNRELRRDPESLVRLGHDRIDVGGQMLEAGRKIYFVMNKPRGVVTTASDEKGRDNVYALLEKGTPWCSPVGRLDQASEGLLLFTNDTDWSNRITNPETHLDKTYHVQIATIADEPQLKRVQRGVEVRDGEVLRVKSAALLRRGERNCWLEIVLHEGKNLQISRLLESQNVEVLRLVRVAIGPLQLGELAKGAVRALSAEEKRSLDRAMRAPSKVQRNG